MTTFTGFMNAFAAGFCADGAILAAMDGRVGWALLLAALSAVNAGIAAFN